MIFDGSLDFWGLGVVGTKWGLGADQTEKDSLGGKRYGITTNRKETNYMVLQSVAPRGDTLSNASLDLGRDTLWELWVGHQLLGTIQV